MLSYVMLCYPMEVNVNSRSVQYNSGTTCKKKTSFLKCCHCHTTSVVLSGSAAKEDVAACLPASAADGQEHEEVAVEYDPQRDEEDETAEHEGVALVGGRGGDVVPCAGGHQALWDVGAWANKTHHS